MNRILLVGFVLCFSVFTALHAQDRTVSGKITASDGSSLPGVNVIVKGTSQGTTSDVEGNYRVTVPQEGARLQFTFIGYTTQEVEVGSRSVVDVVLQEDISELSEVVVVGYGTQQRKELTGSVARVSSEEFKDLPLTSFEQTLQGRTAGVQVMQNSGTPGAGISVRVRGATSLSGSNEPLYVVDGVPINTGNYSQIGVGGQELNVLADLDPTDIESIEVLKDAASGSIYGSRAANGVVLITTKTGKRDQAAQVDISTFYGAQQAWNTLDLVTGPQYIGLLNEMIENGFGPGVDYAAISGLSANPEDYGTTDWFSEVFRTAPIQQHNISISGGSSKTTYRLSGTVFDQEGIVIGSRYGRFNTRLKVDSDITDRLKVGANLAVSRSVNNRLQNDNNINGVISTAILTGSHIPVFREDGTYGRDPLASIENPVAAALEPYHEAVTNRVIGNAYLDYELAKGLTFRSNVGMDMVNFKEDQFFPTTTNTGAGTNGSATSSLNQELNWVMDNTLNYRTNFGDGHNLSALGGVQIQRSQLEGIFAAAQGFPGNDIVRLSAGAVKTDASSSGAGWGLIGYFSRVNYNFKEKLLLSGTFRVDGHSRFGADNRYGVFPGVSAGYVLSEEPFIADIPVISFLKLRGSYGVTGNAEIGNFASLGLFGSAPQYIQRGGLAPTQLPNPDLTWETTTQFDVGMEIGAFDDRIFLTAEYYIKNTDDFLQNLLIPSTSGFTTFTSNIGAMRNEGLEFTLITRNVETNNFSWTTNFNISTVQNVITRLDGAPFAAGFANWVEEGEAVGAFRGYRTDGIFQNQEEINAANAGSPTGIYQSGLTSPGDIRFADLTESGNVTGADQEILGDPWPDFFGGITNEFRYGNFDMQVFFQYSYGNLIYNNTRAFSEGMNSIFGQTTEVLDRWTPDNTETNVPRAVWGDPNNNRRTSDRFLEDGSFIRLKNLNFGYNFPRNVTQRLNIRNLRVFIAGQNLLTFTNYTGLDPEVSTFGQTNLSMGTDFLTYPQARTLTAGINLGF